MNDIYMSGPWVTEDEEEILLDAFRNGWYGEKAYYYCEKFEYEFAKYHDRKHGLMTPNCTTALHLLLAGLNISNGDDVIVPECTWVGSTACITYQHANTIFAGINKTPSNPQNIIPSLLYIRNLSRRVFSELV